MRYPELEQWVKERIALGGSEDAARKSARLVAAMATRLGVPPAELPDDAVSLHFAGSRGSTARQYGVALRSWHRFARERQAAVKSHRPAVEVTDPDMIEWRDILIGEGRTAETFNRYHRAVADLCAIAEKGPRELTKPDILRALGVISARIEARKGRPMRAGYRNAFISALRSFYFCHEVDNAPTRFIRTQRKASEKTKAIEADDFATLCASGVGVMDEANRTHDATLFTWARRHYAATLIMGTCGTRIGMTSRLRPRWLAVRDGHPHFRVPGVVAKGHEGHDDRWIPCPPEVAEWFRTNFQPDEPVYPPTWDSTRATNEFKSFAERFGVFTHPHELRAFTADTVYEKTNGNVKAVKVQLDHDDDATSLGYVGDRKAVKPVLSAMTTTNLEHAMIPVQRGSNVFRLAARRTEIATREEAGF